MNTIQNSDCDSFVDEFYRDSVILITGGTGFIGKVLVEKLLRVFSIKRIYLLIRVKNNMTVHERLHQFFQESVFDRLRIEKCSALKKVYAIEANFDAYDLSISEKNKQLIWNEVDIVFNVVASVKFNEKLRDAIDINVIGTKKILDLVMGIKQLKAFLHISTLFSNCDRKRVEEKVYESDVGYEKIVELTSIMDDAHLEKIQHFLVGKMPNTYTMTKKCSENLVNHKAHYLPAGIFRPAIVISTYKEPVPGWTDNLYGPSGLCSGTVRGYVHVIYGNEARRANLVPADWVVNAMISCAWDIQQRFNSRIENSVELPVYNYIHDDNNLTWGNYMKGVKNGLELPFDKAIWQYSYSIIYWRPLFNVLNFTMHAVPAYLFDGIAFVLGKNRNNTRNFRKLCRVLTMMSYFGLREWQFSNKNIDHLIETMKFPKKSKSVVSDKQMVANGDAQNVLEFDMKAIDWNEYFVHYLPGITKYFFKESTNNRAKQYRRLKLIHLMMKTIFTMIITMMTTSAACKIILRLMLSI